MNTRIVFSPSKRRPGCAILQAALGGDVDPDKFALLFPSETWLVAPTDDMNAYPIDEVHNLDALSRIARQAVKPQSGAPRTSPDR